MNKIIVIDDGSTDNSLKEISKYPVILLKNKVNRGAGYSIIKGLKYSYSLGNSAYTLIADADAQHTSKDLEKIIEETIKSAPLITYAVRNQNKRTPFSKKIASFCAKITLSLFFRIKIDDPYCGLRAFKNEIIPFIQFRDRFEWCTDCARLITVHKKNSIAVQVPAHYSKYSLAKGLVFSEGVKLFFRLLKSEIKYKDSTYNENPRYNT